MSMKMSPAVTTCVLSCLTLGFASVAFGQEMSKGSAPLHDVNGPADFRSSVRPLLAKYCTGCHGTAKPKGGPISSLLTMEARPNHIARPGSGSASTSKAVSCRPRNGRSPVGKRSAG
jgi:hypothetical protein